MRRLALTGVLTALALPGTTSGAVTIGSDLAPDPVAGLGCGGLQPCTVANTLIPGAQVTSPTDGVVVRWRVRVDNDDPGSFAFGARLKVIRPGGGPFTGISTSPTLSIPIGPLQTYSPVTRQPVKAGDQIALDVDRGDVLVAVGQAGPTFARWEPSLADGAQGTPTLFTSPPGTTPEVRKCRRRAGQGLRRLR